MQIKIEHTAPLPVGFAASGNAAGIKQSGKMDLMLLASDRPASVAGTFTTNKICAAPVKLCRERIADGSAPAVVVNSGVANACTGEAGLADAYRMGKAAADAAGIDEEQMLVCSTGHIGPRLPMDKIEQAMPAAARRLSNDHGAEAADAIMTTDTVAKKATLVMEVDGRPIRLTGLAKGAGMIEPNMATMLSFITTDAQVEAASLQSLLRSAVDQSFNRISVDGDQSTNDTVLLFANGAAGNEPLNPQHPAWPDFEQALYALTLDLALQIVADGEGAHKVITIQVRGAATDADADCAARAVANSLLVKTSWVRDEVDWGRVMDCLGYSGAQIEEDRVSILYNGLAAVRQGVEAGEPEEQLRAVVALPEFTIDIDLELGSGSAVVYTCECTEEYVRINY